MMREASSGAPEKDVMFDDMRCIGAMRIRLIEKKTSAAARIEMTSDRSSMLNE